MSRLSRLPIKKARALFEGILEAGVEIYVAQDSKLYTKDSLDNSMDLIISLLRIEAATNYSKDLGNKISKSYTLRKQRFAETGKAYRFKGPGWLKWNDEKKVYERVPEKVKSIERIFQLCLDGYGVRTITRKLNAEKATCIGNYNGKKIRSGSWSNATITRIFTSGEVLGMNPNMDGKIMYPAIIPEKTYYKAKEIMSHRQTHKYYGANRNGENLFQGLCKCSVCDRSIVLHKQKRNDEQVRGANFGKRGGIGARGGKREHIYLWCSGYVAGTCSSKQIIYEAVEESFFPIILDPRFRNMIVNKVYGTKKDTEKDQLALLKGKLDETRKKLAQYAKDYGDAPSNTLAGLMAKTEAQEKSIMGDIENTMTFELGSTPSGEAYQTLLDLVTPKEEGSNEPDWENEETRMKIRECVRALVDRIVVNIKERSYDVFLRHGGKDVPLHVQMYRNGFRVDDKFTYYANPIGGYTIPLDPKVKDVFKAKEPA
jgi:hypothetical protein